MKRGTELPCLLKGSLNLETVKDFREFEVQSQLAQDERILK
jgi:hypothetical protein